MTPTEIQQYLAESCLYIVIHGRGAVIVALEKNELKDVANDNHSDLLEVDDIYVSNDYLTVKYFVKDNVSVTREIPKWQVTFETYNQASM